MFDDILRGLQRIPERQQIKVSVVLDDEGYYDRTCPAPGCGSQFKVLFEDWRDKVPSKQAFCAICGEMAEPPTSTLRRSGTTGWRRPGRMSRGNSTTCSGVERRAERAMAAG